MMNGASARVCWGLALALLASVFCAHADMIRGSSVETVQAARCRIVASAAHATGLPVGVLTRLIWIESRFKSSATSPAGAQGIAQFMPAMAAKRRLLDPYDPEQAIPHAAKLLIDLERRFGNIGLAAAAYNAGSTRVANWLAGSCSLPHAARAYVIALTGRTPEHWAATGRAQRGRDASSQSCIAIARMLRDQDGPDQASIFPWGNTPTTDVHTRTEQRTEFNEGFLSEDAGFLLRHMPDAHLKCCLACSHGVFTRSTGQPVE
jgi:hypothetical protein